VASAASGRLLFLDGLRGLAIIFMVVNHTARWWLDLSVGWPRYHLIYLTVPPSAPLFLFLVGFCLPLSYLNSTVGRGESYGRVAWRYLRRGVLLVPMGWLLTLLVFPNEPLFGGEVLQTIGLSIVGLIPILPLLSRRSARPLILALAIGCYATFNLAHPSLRAWLAGHPVIAEVWFTGFPLWPWFAFPLLGAVLGWVWVDGHRRGTDDRAFFSAGDGHAAQGDGEVCGTAIETPARAQLTIDVRDDLSLDWPIARTHDAWLTFGFDDELGRAAKIAVDGMVALIERELGLAGDDALAFASIAADLHVTQVVNGVLGVHVELRDDAIRSQ